MKLALAHPPWAVLFRLRWLKKRLGGVDEYTRDNNFRQF